MVSICSDHDPKLKLATGRWTAEGCDGHASDLILVQRII